MSGVFNAVAGLLDAFAQVTGLSYNEVNVVTYYMILPLVYLALIDRILGRHWLKACWVAGWTVAVAIVIPDFAAFCDRLFAASVRFLESFRAVGLDYVAASVVVCVVAPLIVLGLLVVLAFPELRDGRGSRPQRPGS